MIILVAHTYATLEGYMPHHETRYFLVDKQATDFDRNWRDPNNCGENLALLNRLIVTTLFPVAVRTSYLSRVALSDQSSINVQKQALGS